MAKQSYGILDGYRGTVGTVIGYQWRGRWCLRARPRQVRNPRTEAQQEHRMVFRDMVQLAGRMKQALRQGLYAASMEEQMTECNLFVKMNKERFTPQGVDYAALEVSRGPVAPVAFTAAEVDEGMVLRVAFEKNPLHLRADSEDKVQVYAFCPALREGRLSAPVFRRDRRLQMALPDEWAGLEVHFYGFVTDYQQRASETMYIDVMSEFTHSSPTASRRSPSPNLGEESVTGCSPKLGELSGACRLTEECVTKKHKIKECVTNENKTEERVTHENKFG